MNERKDIYRYTFIYAFGNDIIVTLRKTDPAVAVGKLT